MLAGRMPTGRTKMMDAFLGWTMLAVGAVVIAVLAVREPRVSGPLVAAYLARAALALIHVYVISLTGGKGDAVNFMRNATEWSEHGLVAALSNFHTGAQIYAWLLSLVFAVTARSELTALGINVLFGSLVTWNVWRLTQVLTANDRAARLAAWCTALFPSLILFSAMTVREVAVIYPFTLGLVFLAQWLMTYRISHFYAALASFLLSALFHPGMAIVIVATGILLAMRWLSSLMSLQGKRLLGMSIAFLGVIAVATTLILTRAGLEKFGNKLTTEAVADQQQGAARSRAAYLQNDIPSSPAGFVAQVPLRSVYFLFTPFPWMTRSPGDVVALFDALAYIAMFLAMLRVPRVMWNDVSLRGLSFVLLLGVVPFAISTSNYGTALRHRAKFAPLVFALYAASGVRRREWRSASLPVSHITLLAEP